MRCIEAIAELELNQARPLPIMSHESHLQHNKTHRNGKEAESPYSLIRIKTYPMRIGQMPGHVERGSR